EKKPLRATLHVRVGRRRPRVAAQMEDVSIRSQPHVVSARRHQDRVAHERIAAVAADDVEVWKVVGYPDEWRLGPVQSLPPPIVSIADAVSIWRNTARHSF